jgi:hypothetical protein
MMESCEDIYENAERFNYPLMVMLAGQDTVIHNGASRQFLKKCSVAKKDFVLKEYAKSYHNIHKEPEYKLVQLAHIYEFIFDRLQRKGTVNFDPAILDKIKYGRPQKRKSLKIKRSIFAFDLIAYLWIGFIVVAGRAFLKFWNGRDLMDVSEFALTFFLWPKIIFNMLARLSYIYYSTGP